MSANDSTEQDTALAGASGDDVRLHHITQIMQSVNPTTLPRAFAPEHEIVAVAARSLRR